MSSAMKMLLVLGGVLTHMPHEMFPRILNTNDSVPVKPKTSQPSWDVDSFESARRHNAAVAKRHRRAEKLRKEHQQEEV